MAPMMLLSISAQEEELHSFVEGQDLRFGVIRGLPNGIKSWISSS
jgi:hypothetical protein